MGFRFEVFQILEDGRRNCFRTCRTFDSATREARFTRRDREYAKRKGTVLNPRFILDTVTGDTWEVK